jgi:hypothetical protein
MGGHEGHGSSKVDSHADDCHRPAHEGS